METIMFQFIHQGPAPSIDTVLKTFNLDASEIDTKFGVIVTDPDEGLYTVLVDTVAVDRLKAVLATRPTHPAEGIFANARIEPFGPPEE